MDDFARFLQSGVQQRAQYKRKQSHVHAQQSAARYGVAVIIGEGRHIDRRTYAMSLGRRRDAQSAKQID